MGLAGWGEVGRRETAALGRHREEGEPGRDRQRAEPTGAKEAGRKGTGQAGRQGTLGTAGGPTCPEAVLTPWARPPGQDRAKRDR